MPLAPGARFAGYTIVSILGTSGIGDVYLAAHPTLERRDTLTILPLALMGDQEFRARFTREAELAATLCHPHIVEVYARGECDGQLWIATEYVHAIDTAQLMRQRFPDGMPPGEALAIVAAVADALDFAHRRGMLHRDVKPANILLTHSDAGERRILLSHFGIARWLGDTRKLTAINLPLETVAYAAPEQLVGVGIDERADQYGLAATAFHLLTGAPPYEATDSVAVVRQRLSAAPPRLSSRCPGLRRLDGVLATALAESPADRFVSCRAFAHALGVRAGLLSGDRSPEAVLTFDYPEDAFSWPPQPSIGATKLASARPLTSRRRRWAGPAWALAAALVVGVIVLTVGIMIGRRGATTSPQAGTAPTATSLPTSSSAVPQQPLLEGAYRVDVNRTQQTYNDAPDPQPPDVTTWWAFRSWCKPTGCVASGMLLDDDNHQTVSPKVGGRPVVLDFRDGAWQSRPEITRFPCVGPQGVAALETMTQVLSLRPETSGLLRGAMIVRVQTDECGQKGGQIVIPAVASRFGDVPPGVVVPGPGK